jgi:RNA polymerase sigma factor (sigma-70 family)
MRLAGSADCLSIPNPEAYLKLTVRNLAIDAHRRHRTRTARVREITIAQENNHDSSVEDVLSSRQELERLATIVAELKPKQRAAFLMHRIDGLSHAEIGRRLHISESGARLYVNQALEHCVKRMGEHS